MFDNNKVRWLIVSFVFLIAAVLVTPNFYKFQPHQWWFSKERLIYGLDIQGGLHLVMGVKVNEAIYEKTKSFTAELKNVLQAEGIEVADITVPKTPPRANYVITESSRR